MKTNKLRPPISTKESKVERIFNFKEECRNFYFRRVMDRVYGNVYGTEIQ